MRSRRLRPRKRGGSKRMAESSDASRLRSSTGSAATGAADRRRSAGRRLAAEEWLRHAGLRGRRGPHRGLGAEWQEALVGREGAAHAVSAAAAPHRAEQAEEARALAGD